MKWLISNFKILGFAALSTVLSGVLGYGWGFMDGKAVEKKNNRIITLEKVVTIREKQNEIRNNRPDTVSLVKRLRDGSF